MSKMSKNDHVTPENSISYKDLLHHLISACNTGLIMPAIDNEGERINIIHSVQENAPTIILFGWTGCTDRYLLKYGKIYKPHEYTVVRCIASTSKTKTFSPYDELADEILKKLPEKTWSKSIVFHLFSMNGCATFLALWKKLSQDQKNCVEGIIFDSAPVYSSMIRSTYIVADSALSPHSGYGWLTRSAYRYLMTSIFIMHRASLALKTLFWDSDAQTKHHPYFILMNLDLPKNLLFLYSTKDEVCAYNDIEKFHVFMKMKKGYNVIARCWDDSPHVEHYRLHPEEYEKLCTDFVENCSNKNFKIESKI